MNNFWIYLITMFAVTYAIRVVPLLLIRHKIKNQFIKSFLSYIPYTVLGAMTFPAVFHAVESPVAGAAGAAIAIALSLLGKGLCTVAAAASICVYAVGLIF